MPPLAEQVPGATSLPPYTAYIDRTLHQLAVLLPLLLHYHQWFLSVVFEHLWFVKYFSCTKIRQKEEISAACCFLHATFTAAEGSVILGFGCR